MKTNYIPQENADALFKVLERAKKLYPKIRFDIIADDEADMIYSGNDTEQAIKEMDGLDCNFGVNCYDGKNYLGWLFVTPYEDEDEIICDCSENDFCIDLLKGK